MMKPKKKQSTEDGVDANRVLHVTIMPCFDRKLEASRLDFVNEETGDRDVDLVLSTDEVMRLAKKHHVNLGSLPPATMESLHLCEVVFSGFALQESFEDSVSSSAVGNFNENAGSGGFLEFVF